MVTLVVSSDEQEYYVHRDLITAESSFFRAALRKTWKEGSEGRIVLPNDTTEGFDLFVRWLYFEHIPFAEFMLHCTSNAPEYHDEILIQAYLLGNKLEATNYKNAVVDALITWNASSEVLPRWPAVQELYQNTLAGDHMRKLLVDMYIWLGCDDKLDEALGETDPDFFFEASVALMRLRNDKTDTDTPPFIENSCVYHEHPKGNPRCNKVAAKDDSE